jgi:superfamily I DNA/RNA helicase
VISEPLPFDSTGINIMSVHKSKGLQADHVFMVGMVEGIIPNALRGLDTVEAQRRLLFVGMSRAKNKLFLLSTIEWDGKYVNRVDKKQFRFDFKSRKYQGRTSTFITELNLS